MPRTNNTLEGFHSSLNKLISVPHPSIWTLIRHLKGIELSGRKKLLDYETGWRPKKTRYIMLTKRLEKILQQYDANQKIKTLKNLAYRIHSFENDHS